MGRGEGEGGEEREEASIAEALIGIK